MEWSKASLLAQAMGKIDEATRAVTPPIHVSSTFIRDPDNQYRSGNIYGRPDNETVREVESVLTMLEGAAASIVLGSGMSAATAVFLALQPGDHVVAPTVMYWALRNWLKNDATAWGLTVDFVQVRTGPEKFKTQGKRVTACVDLGSAPAEPIESRLSRVP